MRAAKNDASSVWSTAGAARRTSSSEIGSSMAAFHVWYAQIWTKNGNPSERSTISSVGRVRPGDADRLGRDPHGVDDLGRAERAEVADGEHPLGVRRRLGDLADEVRQAGEQAPQREPVLAAAVDAGEDPAQVVIVDHVRLVDGEHDAEVVLGGRRGEVGDDVGERFAVGAGRRALSSLTPVPAIVSDTESIDRNARATRGPGSRSSRMRAGLAQQRGNGVVAADRLVADHAEPDVLGHRGERAEQHRLADAAQPGEHQVLACCAWRSAGAG